VCTSFFPNIKILVPKIIQVKLKCSGSSGIGGCTRNMFFKPRHVPTYHTTNIWLFEFLKYNFYTHFLLKWWNAGAAVTHVLYPISY